MSAVLNPNNERLRRSLGPRALRWGAVGVGLLLIAGIAWVAIQKRIWVFETLHRPLAATISAFERDGLKVGSPVMLPRISGVAQAIRLTVEGHDICLLEFDLLDSDQWATVAGIHNSQSTNLLGEQQAAVVSKPLVMVGHDRHPQKDRLIKAFQSF